MLRSGVILLVLGIAGFLLCQYTVGWNTKVVVYVSRNIKIDCATTMENVT